MIIICPLLHCAPHMEPVEYDAMHSQEHSFWWYRALHEITLLRLSQLKLPEHARLLDAGCGTGGLLKQIHQQFPFYNLVGLEYNSIGIHYLQQLHDLSIVNGSINTLPFADHSFDVITLNDVLYHKNIRPVDCLTECWRVLKNKGHLLINVAAYNWMLSTHDHQVHTRERYTTTQLARELKQAGFQIEQSGYWNSLLFPLIALHRLTAGKIKHQSDVKSISPWQNNLFYRIIRTEQLLQKYRLFIPFGGSAWAWASKP